LNGLWSEQGTSPASAIPAYHFAISFEIPLNTGGRIRAQLAIEDIELKKLGQQQTDLRNQIAQEADRQRAIGLRPELSKRRQFGHRPGHEEVTHARDRFQAGVANNIEVITAQGELARANDNQIAALYRYNQSRADLAPTQRRIRGSHFGCKCDYVRGGIARVGLSRLRPRPAGMNLAAFRLRIRAPSPQDLTSRAQNRRKCA
jgi:outer membrane protein